MENNSYNTHLYNKIMGDYENNKSVTLDDNHGKLFYVDFPYIGIGEKPKTKKYATDEELERIIGG